jgi:16S rRNA (uracil1498-N3)-methyltransferase
MDSAHKSPRLFVTAPLEAGQGFAVEEAQSHYLRNVMRCREGGFVRVFNGRDGEFSARIDSLGKKSAQMTATQRLRDQPPARPSIHLVFAPLKKHRMDQVIEKCVELGVTDLHPVITAHTEVREINEARISAQAIEAAEQSERLDVPRLHPLVALNAKMAAWNPALLLFWGAETKKDDAPVLSQALKASAFLVGPVGGFHADECAFLEKQPFVRPVSLGPRVLRAETAAIVCMALANP